MKRIFIYTILLLLTLSSCYNKSADREKVIKIYNWADYIDESVLSGFKDYYKEQTGKDIKIIYQTFDINEIMLTKIERGKEDFDVVCPSEYIIERMLKKDLLLAIDTTVIRGKNYINDVSPFIKQQIGKLSQPGRPANNYAVCYMWGTAGILYNQAYVDEASASSWKCLFDAKYKEKVLMKESYRDVYGTALIYAYAQQLLSGEITVEELMNDYSAEKMAIAEKYMKAMKPQIVGWEADFGKELMTKNKAWINMTWSGDAVWAIEQANEIGVKLDYVVPIEGSNIWYDGWVIPKYAKNVKAASLFINYLCKSDVAIKNMDANGYVSSVASDEILATKIDTTLNYTSDLSYFFGPKGKDIPIDKIQYPDIKVVKRCTMIRDFGDKTQDVLDIWSRMKGDNLSLGITILILVVMAMLTIWTITKRIKHYRRDHLQQHRRKKRLKQKQRAMY